MNMVNYLKKFLYVFSERRTTLFVLIGLFLLVSILEAFGIGSIGIFLRIAEDPFKFIKGNAFLSSFYRDLTIDKAKQFILISGVLIISLFLVKSLVYFISRYFTHKFMYEQRKSLQEKLFYTYFFAPYEFHLSRNSSDFSNKVVVETSRFTYTCVLPLLDCISHLVTLLTLTVLLIKTDYLLLTIILASLLPVLIFILLLSDRVKKWGRDFTMSNEGILRLVNHAFSGLKEIKVIGCESHFSSELSYHTNQLSRVETLFQTVQFVPRISIEALLIVCIIGFLCLSLVLNRNFQESLAAVGIFAIAGLRIVPSASQLLSNLSSLKNSTFTLNSLYSDLKEVENLKVTREARMSEAQQRRDFANQSLQASVSKGTLTQFRQAIQIQDLVYRYPEASEPSINGVTLSIKKGTSVGLIGKSGAGKTTLVDLILGLLEPESGEITVDSYSIYENLASWRKMIGYIPQSIFLLDDTIKHNIALGVPDDLVDQNKLENAIRLAQLEEFITNSPEGINTQVGERGVRLSGGQRQRIGIARALYHERDVLVLDEATSALDNETERLVNQAIESLAGEKTLIVIAHRLSTIENCDYIYMLEQGKVARCGSYSEVIQKL